MLAMVGIASGSVLPTDYQLKLTEEGYVYTTPCGHVVKGQLTESFKKRDSQRSEEETTLTVNVLPSSNDDSYFGVFAFAFNVSNPRIQDSTFIDFETGSYVFTNLPEGEYNIICLQDRQTDNPWEPGVTVALLALNVPYNGEVTLSIDECVYETKWKPVLPDGMPFSHVLSPFGGNSGALENNYFVSYNGSAFLMSGSPTVGCADFAIRTNIENSPFSVFNHAVYMGDYGVAVLQADLNLCNQTVTTEEVNWKTCDPVTFMATPFNKRWTEINEKDYPYLALGSGIVFGAGLSAGYNLRSTDIMVPEGKIMVWKQSGLTSGAVFQHPAGCQIGRNADACIAGQYLNYTEEGLIPVGQNMAYDWEYIFKNGDRSPQNLANGNPRYSGLKYTNIILGNCSPILVLAPKGVNDATGFDFSYVGNYGENMNIDSYNIEAERGQDYTEMYGGPICDFKLSLNGQEVCSTYGEVAEYSWEKGDYVAEISTDNVNIDNELTGYNKAVVNFSKNVKFGTLPTVTALQFRDGEDEITNRYKVSEGAFAEIFAGCFKHEYNENWNGYYNYSPLESVKFEYAPTGNDSWSELEVKTESDLFWPTYGECYRVDMSGISQKSSNGWFDVRVTVTSPDGASTEQTISPAFKVNALNGVKGVLEDSNEIFIDGRTIVAPSAASIYTIEGTKVNSRTVTPGIYIVKTAEKTVKMIVR